MSVIYGKQNNLQTWNCSLFLSLFSHVVSFPVENTEESSQILEA